jgi:adenine-specific DNA methylase
MSYRKKLIEVALPLDAINKASIREKSIRHVHLARTLQKAVIHPCPPLT